MLPNRDERATWRFFLFGQTINSLNYFGIKAYIIKDKVGIWVKVRKDKFAKIAAIGVRVRKWVTYHGIAINISTDLSKFGGIIPCGLENSLVTSLNQLGIYIEMSEFDKIIQTEFNKIFKWSKNFYSQF